MDYLLEENIKKLEDIHYANFELIKEADRLFKKHNIQYFLAFGTLLGAVRHNDFIPWDDDVDICMTRSEYNRMLKEKVLDDISDEFEVVYPDDGNVFFDAIIKINYKKSKLENPNEKTKYYNEKHNKISLDIFVLDKTYKGIRGMIQRFRLKVIYGQAMAKRYKINYSKYSFIQRIEIRILSLFGRRKNVTSLISKYNKIASMYSSSDSKYLFFSNDLLSSLNNLCLAEYFSSTVEVKMRDKSFPSPIEYDKYLSKIYGDYMKLPPENERIPLHAKYSEVEVEYLNK